MKWASNILVFTLILTIIGSSLMVPLIHLDFEVRRDYIAKVLCLNREQPIAVCGGKCYLAERLKEAAEHQEKEADRSRSNQQIGISFFAQEQTILTFQHLSYDIISHSCGEVLAAPRSFIHAIFRPPKYTSFTSDLS